MIKMPICPNCGSYIPLGNHSCECGTTIGYDEDLEDSSQIIDQIYKERRKNENPYEDDFFNEMHHEGFSPYLINSMDEGIRRLKNRYSARLENASFHNNMVFFDLKHENEYYDATLRASFDLSSAFNDVILYRDIVTPDFTKLYSNERFRKVIREKEREKNSKFHYCRLLIVDDMMMVSAVFDERGYIIDFDDNLNLIE